MKSCTLLFCLLLSGTLSGQGFHFRQAPSFTEGDVRQITQIYQSSDQMIWMGTDKGVYAFDGRKYRYHPRPDKEVQEVTTIDEGPGGQIWVGYHDGCLQVVSLQGVNQIILADSIKDAAISQILFQTDGKVFISTYGEGMWILDKGNLSRIRFNNLALIDDIYDALLDLQGRIWMATDDGIWIYQQGQTESLTHLDRYRGLPDEIVTKLQLEDNGDVWIGLYDHGLARFISAIDTILPLMSLQPSAGNVIGLIKGRTGEVWMGTEKSVSTYSFGGTNHSIEIPAECKERLQSLFFDSNGNLWLASGNKLFVANTQIEYILPGVASIQAIAVTNEKLWLGSEFGLYGLDRDNLTLKPFLERENINILSMYKDPSGLLWIGTFGQGVYIFNPEDKSFMRLTESDHLSNNSVLNIDGRDQTVWLATLGGVTEIKWRKDPMKDPLEIIDFLDKFNFPAGYVYDVYADDAGKTWFGTDGKGLYYLDHDQLKPLVFHSGKTTIAEEDLKTIYSITSDTSHTIWISGSKGNILHFDMNGNVLRQIDAPQGSVNSLVTSGKGEILMIREGAIQISNPGGEMYFYNESSGLKSFIPNINATAKDLDGSVWMADADQILHYIPFNVNTHQSVQMHLEAVSPASLLSKEEIRLSPDSNFLDIRFTGLWYDDPSAVRYRYMLEGHDKDWIYTREGRAVYSKLAPGTYTFVVAGSYTDDFANVFPLKRTIIVLPPIFLRWWFILGASVMIICLIIAYIMASLKRINKLHQLEKEKTMLRLHAIQAQVNPHFLFNSFNTLSSIIEEDQQAAVDYVDQFSGFFRGVLMHRDAELIRIEEEMDIVRNYTYILQKRYGQNLRIIEEIKNSSGLIAPLSIQLLVENAIKHNIVSAEKPLYIYITIDDHWITIANALQPKIQGSTESTGFGLTSLVARYQYLSQVKIEIREEQNTFTVKIPIITEKPL